MPQSEKMGEFAGILHGIEKDIQEIKTDIKKIESNDYQKIERIRACEMENEASKEWKTHHLEDNRKTNELLADLRDSFDDYKSKATIVMGALFISVVGLLLAVIIDILRMSGG